jgi:hypothetical protein
MSTDRRTPTHTALALGVALALLALLVATGLLLREYAPGTMRVGFPGRGGRSSRRRRCR